MHGVRGAVELNDGQPRDAPGRQRRRHLAHGRPPGRADDEPRVIVLITPVRTDGAVGIARATSTVGVAGAVRAAGLREPAGQLDETGGGDSGHLLEAMDLRGALAHGHDMRAHSELGLETRLRTARSPGMDQLDAHDPLPSGPGEQARDRRARAAQMAGDDLHGLGLDVVHGGGLEDPLILGGRARARGLGPGRSAGGQPRLGGRARPRGLAIRARLFVPAVMGRARPRGLVPVPPRAREGVDTGRARTHGLVRRRPGPRRPGPGPLRRLRLAHHLPSPRRDVHIRAPVLLIISSIDDPEPGSPSSDECRRMQT